MEAFTSTHAGRWEGWPIGLYPLLYFYGMTMEKHNKSIQTDGLRLPLISALAEKSNLPLIPKSLL